MINEALFFNNTVFSLVIITKRAIKCTFFIEQVFLNLQTHYIQLNKLKTISYETRDAYIALCK